MEVRIQHPKYQVRIYKTVQRQTVDGKSPTSSRFRGTQRMIDLAPWLGDGSSITTQKSVRDAAGGFALTVADRPYADAVEGGLDSLYGLIEPMDLVEIRLLHNPQSGQTTLPVVMRGFVAKVSRNEGMSPEGKPERSVVINGHDYGKIWQMLQIFYGPEYIIGSEILSTMRLLDQFGGGFNNAISNKDFVRLMIEGVVNPFLAKVLPAGSGFPLITVSNENVQAGATGIAGIQTQEGTVYDLLKTYMDVGAFNELFLTEDDDGVYCVYRQNPVLDLDGKPVDTTQTRHPYSGPLDVGATTLAAVSVDIKDVESINLSRSDEGVANYYWVQAPSFSLNSDVVQRQVAYTAEDRASVDLSAYPNSAQDLYGLRMMRLSTTLGGAIDNVKSGLTQEAHEQRDALLNEWLRERRKFVVAQNKDNSLLESGTIRMRGNERIRPGNYINLRRGAFSALYYVTTVSHQFMPYRGFFTTLTVERGLGFANRIKMASGIGSPYLAEQIDYSRAGA